MAAASVISGLLGQIREYRQKYYQNELLKGIIISLSLILCGFLFVNTLEYFGRFDTFVRGTLFFAFVLLLVFSAYRWIVKPTIGLLGLQKTLSDEAAAAHIGRYFPEIGDKLLNTLQLSRISGGQTDLIQASIKQKSSQLMIVKFSEAVRFNENKKYLRYAIYPVSAVGLILILNPAFFTGSSERLIHFNEAYTEAPFSFIVQNDPLRAFRNDDFTVHLALKGSALPTSVYLVQNGTRFKLEKDEKQNYFYTFKNIQRDTKISFDAAGYSSKTYTVSVIERPELRSFDVTLHYPSYLHKPSEVLNNVGNLTVPQGTQIEWNFNTTAAKSLAIKFEGDSVLYKAKENSGETFQLNKRAIRSGQYQVFLQNNNVPNADKIGYFLNVIPDKFPVISTENFQDTTLYNYLIIGGSISDDYGFSDLKLFYTIQKEGLEPKKNEVPRQINIPFNKTTNTQSFYFQWYVDSLRLSPGDKIEYFAQVWDNDGVNGPKSTRSRITTFAVPSKDQLKEEIDQSNKETEAQIEKTLKKAKDLEKNIDNLEKRLKSNNELDFQERKQAEEILKKREELLNEIKNLQEQNKNSNDKAKQLNKQSPELQKKLEQLQKLIDELMNNETSKLYQELQKMLEQKQSERMSKMLERLKNKEQTSSKEIDRALQLFKKMQLEQKMENVANQLEELAEKQEELSKETEKTDDQKSTDNQIEQQEQLQKALEMLKKQLEDIEKTSKELDSDVDTMKDEQKEATSQMENSKKQLSQKSQSKAAQSQKKAAQSMRKMSSQMSQASQGMEMEQLQEDMDALRDILENLIAASFEQERLMKEIRQVNLQDPRFVKLGQDQIKLQSDTKIIEDSLYALANRNVQIQSFITRELNEMKFQMNESISNIRDRKIGVAAAKQQFTMTAMNNLSLMLSDVFKQMQQAMMAMAMPGQGKSGKQKQKGQGDGEGLGERQDRLNQQIQKLSKGQREGTGGQSEELARAAAEQAAIRKMIEDLMESQKGTALGDKIGKELKEAAEKMDETETDLVNKRVSPELIKRNQEIVTRLLESEKAMREQDEDEQRKGETANQVPRKPPAAFENYIREKERQTELLRSVPPNFSPFYKREADAYFRKYQGK